MADGSDFAGIQVQVQVQDSDSGSGSGFGFGFGSGLRNEKCAAQTNAWDLGVGKAIDDNLCSVAGNSNGDADDE